MRMFRLPSWISESRGCDRVVNGDADIKMAHAMGPVMGIPSGGVAKRKRGVSEDIPDMTDEGFHEPKRRKKSVASQSEVESTSEHSLDEKAPVVTSTDRVRETIEAQFSLEILLKHNELRLINQELAKCQVALEQLRRCSLIPYPTSQGTQESMFNISNGTGPALAQRNSVPQWAPAYGVTDGPYTRHYAKWLIPDPTFDGAQVEWHRTLDPSRAGKTVQEGRSTRNSFGDFSTSASKARSQRGSTGQKLQALSSGYPQAKEKAGPCILKRQDGQMVKLVCIDCQRENFSSTQGFINHCRIAHRRDFKSHEEAAVASGQPIEIDEVGGIVGEEKPPTSATGLVHPLIRSAPTDREAYVALLSRIDASMALFKQGKLQGVASIPSSANSTPLKSKAEVKPHRNFVASSETPHLSNLMRSRGLDVNLTDMVGEAKTQLDFDEMSSHEDESEDGEKAPQRSLGGLDGADSPIAMRMPARAAMSSAPFGRPTSSKGVDSKHARKLGISPRMPFATPAINTAAPSHSKPASLNVHDVVFETPPDVNVDIDMMGPSYADLSPNTVASNNAPSLVSDDGEYDDGDDDAESTRSEDESEGSDVAEIDIEDGEVEKVVPRTVLRNRSGSGSEGMRLRKEEKHVAFVSPVKDAKAKGRTRK
jgi:ADA HAT complex component 1